MPASDFVDPMGVQEFAGGCFYPIITNIHDPSAGGSSTSGTTGG